MQVFISWSGDASKRCAEALREWLPFINQEIAPFVSSQDISKGERGLNAIATQLQECSFGIVCVTRDNQSAPWINFESGAISRVLGENSLAPFLLDMPIKDLTGPLTQFQATESSSQEDVWAMVKSINDKCENIVEHERLRTTFDKFRGDLENKLQEIRDQQPKSQLPERDTSEILNELVGLVREQSVRLGGLEKRVSTLSTSPQFTINEPREMHISSTRGDFLSSESAHEIQQRAMTAVRRIEEMLGPDAVLQIAVGKYSTDITLSERAAKKVRGFEATLADVAIRYRTAISLRMEDGTELYSHPPF
ncbi:TIR domain-containing protein [Streptomyces mirabilis]|uniref:TIR domain-containing protein n=1 Tax=Streptomyces mirabilis TaxID=68239 RepID=A0ABU3UKS1_9ACTN|nr:TIR domain-containing protein [Streptomyces mirabilis]MDU8994525.1 TIR domain-containing protein [Streptomyces mirabilis]